MSLPQDIAALPVPLQAQVGAYLHKQIPAICKIEVTGFNKSYEPVEKAPDITQIIYKILHNNKTKFTFWTYDKDIENWNIKHIDRFLQFDISNQKSESSNQTSNNAVCVEIYHGVEELCLIFLDMKNKTISVSIGGNNKDPLMVNVEFPADRYKGAFDTFLTDLQARYNHMKSQ